MSSVPMSEAVMIYDAPVYGVPLSYSMSNSIVTSVSDTVYVGESVVTQMPYTAAKPTEKVIALPLPLAPLLPIQDDSLIGEIGEKVSETVRGQTRTMESELAEILDTPPSVARGAVEEGTIDPKLTESPVSQILDPEMLMAMLMADSAQSNSSSPASSAGQTSGTKSTDPLDYGVLLFATILTTAGLVYMAFVAYDYRQRWMQLSTMQNDRYLGGGGGAFDMEAENTYSGSSSFSENFGLTHHSI